MLLKPELMVLHRIDDLENKNLETSLSDYVLHRIDDLEIQPESRLEPHFVLHRIDDLEIYGKPG